MLECALGMVRDPELHNLVPQPKCACADVCMHACPQPLPRPHARKHRINTMGSIWSCLTRCVSAHTPGTCSCTLARTPPPAHARPQKREDAARAMEAMDGMILHDFELRIGWGKAMTLPLTPVWPGPGMGASHKSVPSGLPNAYATHALPRDQQGAWRGGVRVKGGGERAACSLQGACSGPPAALTPCAHWPLTRRVCGSGKRGSGVHGIRVPHLRSWGTSAQPGGLAGACRQLARSCAAWLVP